MNGAITSVSVSASDDSVSTVDLRRRRKGQGLVAMSQQDQTDIQPDNIIIHQNKPQSLNGSQSASLNNFDIAAKVSSNYSTPVQ